jgi:hypothetical protein
MATQQSPLHEPDAFPTPQFLPVISESLLPTPFEHPSLSAEAKTHVRHFHIFFTPHKSWFARLEDAKKMPRHMWVVSCDNPVRQDFFIFGV